MKLKIETGGQNAEPVEFNKTRRLYEVGYVEANEIGLNEVDIFKVDRGRALLEYDKSSGLMAIHLPELDQHNNYTYNHKLIFSPDMTVKNEQQKLVDASELYDLTGLNLSTIIKAYENISTSRTSAL